MEPPPVRYARSGSVNVAYQVVGNGPTDIVFGTPFATHLGVWWEWPPNARFFEELSSFSRLILFDKRGTGLSDRAVGVPPLAERIDDIRAVMDAAASRNAVLFGASESAPMSVLFAATYPERTAGLILLGGSARHLAAPDYPWEPSREEAERAIVEQEREWATDSQVRRLAAGLAPALQEDPGFLRWLTKLGMYGASPASAAALARMNIEIDVRPVLSSVQAPTLVMAEETEWALGTGRYTAEHIVGARFAVIPGASHLCTADPKASKVVLDAVRSFIDGLPGMADSDRVLTTVLFTDIENSTERLSALGDRGWSQVLEGYLGRARAEVERFRGHLIKSTGDGILATFDGPTRAVRCAATLRDYGHQVGIETRAGLHTGECLIRGGDVQGIAVHIASRVGGRAAGGEVLVSGTVRDLSIGSDLRFADRGVERLRGVEGEWRLFALESKLPSV